ncbi:MAG: response regulator [Lachnospiraceae bacterium]|nr:response regulator [Lachnospiraceae bacterium]
MGENRNWIQKILIVDDSEMNRDILTHMLGEEYEIIEAEDGGEAVAILRQRSTEISLVLLDIVMPVMDGYEVLTVMNRNRWIEDIPVIMISSENSSVHIQRAYELGVTDFITRPFDSAVVRRRVANILLLYAKQKNLVDLVSDQIYEKQKNSSLMIAILSHIVEFRNGESGLHVLHVQALTEILLKYLVQRTDRYKISGRDIALISNASALHDIGKISISDEILNKPGRLTKEEFEIMKTHSLVGASMIRELPIYQEELLVKTAYEICRWHHERYDGKGYPDGLKGDQIPISAQIVSLADVYDALTSERVYKKAYTHETAMEMILNGECGTFNPLLLNCLKDAADEIKRELKVNSINFNNERQLKSIMNEMLGYKELSASKRTLHLLENERTKNEFFAEISKEIRFEYTVDPSLVTFSRYGAERLGLKETIMEPKENEELWSAISREDIHILAGRLEKTSFLDPVVEYECDVNYRGKTCRTQIIARAMWTEDETPKYEGTIGKLIPVGENGEIKIQKRENE